MISRQNIAYLQALAAAVLFGAGAPLAKLLLAGINEVMLAGFLYLGSGMLAALALIWTKPRNKKRQIEASLARGDYPWLAGATICGGILAPILLMFSLKLTPASNASVLLNFELAATSLIALAIFREQIGRRVWLAIGLITAASLILSWNPTAALKFSIGALGVLAAASLWGMDNNFTCRISTKNPMTIVFYKGFTAGIVSLVIAVSLGSPIPGIGLIGSALLLGSLSYGLSIMLFIYALRNLGASRTSALFATAPFIGALLALAIFPEIMNINLLASMILMAGGTYILLSERHAHEHEHLRLTHDHGHSHRDEHHQHAHIECGASVYHSHVHLHPDLAHSHSHTPDAHHHHEHP